MKMLVSLVRVALIALIIPAPVGGQSAPPSATASSTNNFPSLTAEGIHNVFRLGDRLYSGSAPEGNAGFASLKALGIRTIISVDGTPPDVALAHENGLRYVHLPHGYDGISTNVQVQLIKAAQSLPGPIYIHCHHGLHRGPVAAAVICMGTDGWSPARAEAWLHNAGTATNYEGLFEAVRRFRRPSPAVLASLPPNFPETARLSGLVDAMVAIDQTWDRLKAVRKAGYQPPPDHLDLQPAHEARMLSEHFRETQRLSDSTRRGDEFLRHLRSSESAATAGEVLLGRWQEAPGEALARELGDRLDTIGKACASCHKAYRD